MYLQGISRSVNTWIRNLNNSFLATTAEPEMNRVYWGGTSFTTAENKDCLCWANMSTRRNKLQMQLQKPWMDPNNSVTGGGGDVFFIWLF